MASSTSRADGGAVTGRLPYTVHTRTPRGVIYELAAFRNKDDALRYLRSRSPEHEVARQDTTTWVLQAGTVLFFLTHDV
jgi:hypothetical protein